MTMAGARKTPRVRAREIELTAARRRAATKLIDLHPGDFEVLFQAECVAAGIDPPGSRPNGRPPQGGAQ